MLTNTTNNLSCTVFRLDRRSAPASFIGFLLVIFGAHHRHTKTNTTINNANSTTNTNSTTKGCLLQLLSDDGM